MRGARNSMNTQNILIDELEEALSDGSAERRIKTLRRVTDLFVFGSGHFSADHVAVFDGVFSHLVVNIDLSARVALAGRLATIQNAPPRVMRALAFDDAIDVAGPVLAQSDILDSVTLVENGRTKSQQHLLAITRRKSLPETVTDVLVERGNREVALSVARNTGAKLSEVGYIRLIKRSEQDGELAQSVGERADISRQHFLKLLGAASQAVRQTLEAAHPEYASEIQIAVAEVATAMQAKAAAASRNYVAAIALVESLRVSGRFGESDIEAFARAGKFEETVAALAMLSALPIDVVERAMVQDRAETILIVAKAVGVSWLTAKAVLLLRAGKGGMSAHTLDQCQAVFNRLKRETAQEVVEFQRKRQKAGQSKSF